MSIENLSAFFTDAGWRQFAFPQVEKIGAYPNRLYFNAAEKLGAVVAFRGERNSNSWALNEKAINYVGDAISEGKIVRGYAILATRFPDKIVSAMEVGDVMKVLAGVPCRQGNWGPFWWVYENFKTDEMVEVPF